MRPLLAAWILVVSAAAAAQCPPPAAGTPGAGRPPAPAPLAAGAFVRVDGTRLVLQGKPFRFVGANLGVMHDQPWRSRYRDTLAAAACDGLTVGRIWALGEGTPDAEAWRRQGSLFRAGPDGWIEDSLRHLDRVLAEARRQGVRLIVTLSNNWGDYGGVPMYLRWGGVDPEEWGGRTRFFADVRIRGWYRAHLERVVGRVNSVTGVAYRDDPTILAWELMNESTFVGDEAARARRAWIVEMARLVKKLDPNHLVSPGLLGYDSRREREEWLRVMQLPEVDYCDLHFYPTDNEHKLKGRAPIERAVDDAAQLARFVARKPLVIGEFGFPSQPPLWEGLARPAWFDVFLGRALDDGAAGVLAWIYEPWQGRERAHGIYFDNALGTAVRSVLRKQAALLAAGPPELRNPQLRPERGVTPFLDQTVTVTTKKKPATVWKPAFDGSLVLEVAPGDFTGARWERLGTWDGGPLVHAYGSDSGWFEYGFQLPPNRKPRELHVRARLSSEFPGSSSPPEGYSTVQVSIDGLLVARLVVIADDGIGRWYQVTLEDRALLARLATGAHTLRFEVPDGPHARGVAIYGANTGKGTIHVDDGGPLSLKLISD
jgi:mannan endo-1,4-beta-mannosidase